VVAMGEVARRAFQTWVVDEVAADAVAHGRRIEWVPAGAGPVAVTTAGGELLALAELHDGLARYLAVFV
jgi:hypothetical protein